MVTRLGWGKAMVLVTLVPVALVAAACSSSSSTASSSAAAASGYGASSSGTAPASAAGAKSANLVGTGTAIVKGASETVLTTSSGRTLYYFTPDTSTKAACGTNLTPSGQPCTTVWPPLVAPPGTTPTSSSHLPGTLSAVSDGNGNQVEYQGHPLYTFSGDSASGQANGQGLLGKWYVATPSLAAGSSAGSGSSSSSSSSTSGGYGSGY